MLVLTRKKYESIMIGDDVEVFIVEIQESKVRLGIKASEEIPVHRREVYDSIKRGDERKEKPKKSETGYHKPGSLGFGRVS